MSKKGGRKQKKEKEVDPELLPSVVTHVGPHNPLYEFFAEDQGDDFFENWADFYEKRPKIAVKELITTVLAIAGHPVLIDDKDIKKGNYQNAQNELQEAIKEDPDDTPIKKYFKGTDTKAFDFWKDWAKSLIVTKGLYNDTTDIFKDWLFAFCESKIPPLREAATVAIASLTEFLADSIAKASEALKNLDKTKQKSAVATRQREEFQNELESSKALIMQFYTTVIRTRGKDISNNIRKLCTTTMGNCARIAPTEFGRDNKFIDYLGKSLNDQLSSIKKEALKQLIKLVTITSKNKEINTIAGSFKNISRKLPPLCKDTDNGIVILAFELMSKMVNAKVFGVEEVDDCFQLTSDESENVREAAAKFFMKFIFDKIKNDDKNVRNEEQIKEFSRLAEEFSDPELNNSVSAFYPHLKALQEWDLITQIILSDEEKDKNEFYIKLLSISATNCPEEDLKSMTSNIIRYIPQLLENELGKKKNEEILEYLTKITTLIDIDEIEGENTLKRQFSSLLKQLHTCFVKHASPIVIANSFASLRKYCQSGNKQLSSLADKELKSLSKEVKDKDLGKLVILLEFVDRSKDAKLRTELINEVESEDDERSPLAISCLENMYKWDIKRMKDMNEDDYLDYSEVFSTLQVTFGYKLHSDSMPIKAAAFKAVSTLFSLSPIIKNVAVIDDSVVNLFFKEYHQLDDKISLFKYLARPLLSYVPQDSKYVAHALWYYQEPELRPQIKQIQQAYSDICPLPGVEVGDLVRTVEYTPSKLKVAMNYMAKHLRCREIIDSWLDQPDDSLIPVYAPVLQTLSASDADILHDNTNATGKTLELLGKIANGTKLKATDFAVSTKKKTKLTKSTKGKVTNSSGNGSDEENSEDAQPESETESHTDTESD